MMIVLIVTIVRDASIAPIALIVPIAEIVMDYGIKWGWLDKLNKLLIISYNIPITIWSIVL